MQAQASLAQELAPAFGFAQQTLAHGLDLLSFLVGPPSNEYAGLLQQFASRAAVDGLVFLNHAFHWDFMIPGIDLPAGENLKTTHKFKGWGSSDQEKLATGHTVGGWP